MKPFSVQSFPITGRAMWLDMRRMDVTASGAAALLGQHPYQTAYGLWCEKTGAVVVDGEQEMTEAMERGVELEPLAVRRLAKLHPSWSVSQPNVYFRDPEARLGCTPDCFVTDPTRPGRGVVQIKSVEPGIFRRDWHGGEDGAVEPPLWIVVQAIIEAHLTGASWAAVAALVIGYGIKLHLVEVPLHAGIIGKIRAEVADFWRMIAEGRRPDPDYKRDGALIARLFADPADVELDLSGDNELAEAVFFYRELGKDISNKSEERDACRAEILHKMGNASSARIATGVITAKLTKRAGYTVKPAQFRTIRFKENAT